MVKSSGIYLGDLNCQLTHGPSGKVIETDAPVDNQGRGLAFSPTDLAAAALASCMVTTMAIAARNKLGFDLNGTRWEVTKEMSTDAPRRIVRLGVDIWLPIPAAKDPTGALERAARGCPVHQSLAAAVEQVLVLHWKE